MVADYRQRTGTQHPGCSVDSQGPSPRVAYVLKGYPSLAELFIATEIWRLERLGLPLQLYVLQPPEEDTRHPIIDRIRTAPIWLPDTTSLSTTRLMPWLARNVPSFCGPLRRVAGQQPRGLAVAAGLTLAQAGRLRQSWRARKRYVEELLWAVALADEIESGEGVDHLHAHFAHGTTTVAWLAARILNVPFSFTGHAEDIYQASLNPAGLLARKLDAAAFTITCSRANLDYLRSISPGADVHLVYHGIDAELARLLADAPPAEPPGHLRIASVGHLVPEDGFDVLLRAVAELRHEGHHVELVVAGGEGTEAESLSALTGELGLSDVVRFRGPISQSELLAELRRASVFVLARRAGSDGDRDIPNVLMEAMAAGIPVVSTTVSGIPELVEDGVNGLLVPPDDARALAKELARVALDPELAQQLARAGSAAVAERFDSQSSASHLAALFASGGRS